MQLDAFMCNITSRGSEIWVVWIAQVPHSKYVAKGEVVCCVTFDSRAVFGLNMEAEIMEEHGIGSQYFCAFFFP